MQLQHEEFSAASAPQPTPPEAEQVSSIGVIAVAAGAGFKKVFRSLGAAVVEGGQTMNPSVQEILAAVNSSGYPELILLPTRRAGGARDTCCGPWPRPLLQQRFCHAAQRDSWLLPI